MTRSLWKGPFIEASLLKILRFFRIRASAESMPGHKTMETMTAFSDRASPDSLLIFSDRASQTTDVASDHSPESLFNRTNVLKSLDEIDLKKESALRKIWSRRSTVVPQFVGCFTQVYNGKKWIGLKITEEMVGHKFGEFASTRTIGAGRSRSTKISKTKLKAKTR